jgi:hypothetical protein
MTMQLHTTAFRIDVRESAARILASLTWLD